LTFKLLSLHSAKEFMAACKPIIHLSLAADEFQIW